MIVLVGLAAALTADVNGVSVPWFVYLLLCIGLGFKAADHYVHN